MVCSPGESSNYKGDFYHVLSYFRKKIEKNVILAFYKGIKISPNSSESKSWDEDSYKIFDPSTKPNGTIDIPANFRSLNNYCASLAHKVANLSYIATFTELLTIFQTNHSFIPNSEFVVFDHPR